jgi:hypothetical protein
MTNFVNTPSDRSSEIEKPFFDKLQALTARERKYFMTMWPKSGVLYITSKTGIAK